MDDTGTVVAFYMLAALTIVSALGVVVVRNLIHAAVFLILSFVGVAGLYITLSADFVAVTQVLIYAGAVSVLILFAIVLTPTGDRANQETFFRLPGLLRAPLVSVTLGYVPICTGWAISDSESVPPSAVTIPEAVHG